MSIMYCEYCDNYIDTDYHADGCEWGTDADPFHFKCGNCVETQEIEMEAYESVVERMVIYIADSAIKYIKARKDHEEEVVKEAYRHLYKDVMDFVRYEDTLKELVNEEKLHWWSAVDADKEYQDAQD